MIWMRSRALKVALCFGAARRRGGCVDVHAPFHLSTSSHPKRKCMRAAEYSNATQGNCVEVQFSPLEQ